MSDRNFHIPAGFNAQDLFLYLSKFTEDERKECEIFIRLDEQNRSFNIKSMDYIEEGKYSFFGKSIPCLILNDERFVPKAKT